MKSKILNILKSSDTYVSGEEMSKKLGISRSAIWKHISQLKNEGYVIESITNNGYKLIETPDILTYDEISQYLHTQFVGRNILHFKKIESTNKYAKTIANESVDGTVVIAEEQTAGRGRLGRQWVSPQGKGIWMSILLKPDILPTDAHKLTLLTASSVFNALKEYKLNIKIKWPNDILINNKKVCGILTEMSAELNKINFLVIGIGINVNIEKSEFGDDLKDKATSLKIEIGNDINRKKLTAEILNNFESLYLQFLKNNDISKTLDIARNNSALINNYVEITTPQTNYVAKVIGIADDCTLIIENNGKIERLISGEVSLHTNYNTKI